MTPSTQKRRSGWHDAAELVSPLPFGGVTTASAHQMVLVRDGVKIEEPLGVLLGFLDAHRSLGTGDRSGWRRSARRTLPTRQAGPSSGASFDACAASVAGSSWFSANSAPDAARSRCHPPSATTMLRRRERIERIQ
jgi:hypothetical protein